MMVQPYPSYTRAERLADGVVHVTGLVAAVTGVAMLLATNSTLASAPWTLLYVSPLLHTIVEPSCET